MPRKARLKNCDAIYHIMSRSISDLSLYRDNRDKDKYLDIVKIYQDLFRFKVYCFCLMNTHSHFIIDANGADISKIYHGINQSYAFYFNKKYKRHGHVFQDRFKSVIVDNDAYLMNLTGYIHSNPVSIKKFKGCPEKYIYSSLGLYLDIREDFHKLVDKDLVMSKFNKNEIYREKSYKEFVKLCRDDRIKEKIEFENDRTRYESCRIIISRHHDVDEIIHFIITKTNCSEETLRIKSNRKTLEQRALFVFFMRCFCNYKQEDICKVIGNITQSRVSRLCVIGMEFTKSKEKYKNLVVDFIKAA
jgi:putative transposase